MFMISLQIALYNSDKELPKILIPVQTKNFKNLGVGGINFIFVMAATRTSMSSRNPNFA